MAAKMTFTNPFTVVNAPAGSGKTTSISKSIKQLIRHSNKKILCITFTNRAAEQLLNRIDDEQVEVSTIHSFISNFLSTFFEKREVVDLYVEVFGSEIVRILSSSKEKDIEKIRKYKNKKDIEEDEIVNLQTVIANIRSIYYNETQFTSHLYGGLSHDDLLRFSREIFKRFSKIRNVITQAYSHVFIDEYQDTKHEILELFYYSLISTSTKLVLMGDEMQQIYSETVNDFQHIIEKDFYKDNILKNNWRSQEHIVNVLNNLYFDEKYKQIAVIGGIEKPKVHIIKTLNEANTQEGALQLVLRNQELFEQINAINLYNAFEERYAFYDKYNSKQIITDMTSENPDELMAILIFITDIIGFFDTGRHSQLIRRVSQYKYSNKALWDIHKHEDKVKINSYLRALSQKIKEDMNINELFSFLAEIELIEDGYIDELRHAISENEDFERKILEIKYAEFNNCYQECKQPSVSTQHAVKGEGHDVIALKLADSSSLNVQMYLFLELLAKDIFDYKTLKGIVNQINALKTKYSEIIGDSLSGIKTDVFKEKKELLDQLIGDIIYVLTENEDLHNFPLVKDSFQRYRQSSNVTNFKKCISVVNKLEGSILAYKLFYVGCSRAKEKLDVYLCEDKIQGFITEFSSKMERFGFEVINETIQAK
ncbi:UvrD-helicase domain-containing protein [Cohnella terricola]|uniref:ATP-dependent helicase n=1 Tax=Cohnella terricola TaxID=1289167 RepID=A0A559JEN6_9BACL|nr:ATP-dependent helicase [Cohnella terricola]TVX98330.1 ATP-dependent helicase [Cohnella terricola]